MSTSLSKNLNEMNIDDMVFVGPNGHIVKVEDILSIRGVRVNDVKDIHTKFSVDFLDIQGSHFSNYTCSFDTLNLAITMLFAESDLEDSTKITVNFDALATMMVMSWIKGMNETSMDRQSKQNDLEYAEEDAEEEYNKIKNNMLVN